jgi:chromosome segregation protein
MYLNKLEIFGFKSFADKVVIDFDAGVTSIVGPNGCGKTNIVDAVRWVIGEQKASVLRSSTMENVIFNGTNDRKALGYAEVSLTIENTKGILPSEYSEIKITRRCFRDGTSAYLLNGTVCRLKDITALFMDTGMGSDAYSVIELKMVNEILSHRTQDRRKLFEEAAGITKYKERRREALYKLEVAKENLTEAGIEIRNRQRTVNAYERIAQKQQEAKEISERLKILEIDYHQRKYSKLIDDTKQTEANLKQKEDERESLQAKLNENESIIDKYKQELSVTESKLNETRDRFNRINLQISSLQSSISMAEQRISHLQENIGRFSKEKIELEQQIEKLKSSKLDIIERIRVLKNTASILEKTQQTQKRTVDETENKVKRSKEELKDLAHKHSVISKNLLEKGNEYELTKKRLEDQLERCSKLADENILNINKISEFDREIKKADTELTELTQQLETLEHRYTAQKKVKDSLAEEINSLEKEIIYRTLEAEKLQQKIEMQKSFMENYDDYSEGIRYLVKEKGEDSVKVIIDKLEVEDKFKIAIETALGEISNYLIVNSLQDAEKHISVLANEQKGKVTFIIKDVLYQTTFNIFQDEFPEILGQPGVYGWADKFIKCPDEYWMLYKYLLDEYIIVENFEIAKRLSRDNFIKFITLDGDIVTSSFIRAGGKTNAESLKIGREKFITDLKSQLKAFEITIEQEKFRLEDLQKRHRDIDIDSLQDEITKLRSGVQSLGNSISQINYRKSQVNSLIEANNRENETVNDSTNELKVSLDTLISEVEKAENERYQREKELEHFTTELENLADNLTSKREEYNTFSIESAKVKAELTNCENDLIRTDENVLMRLNTIESRVNETQGYQQEITKLRDELEFTGEEGKPSGLRAKLAAIEFDKSSIESDLTLVTTEYEVKKKLVDKVEHDQRTLREGRDGIISFIHQNEMQLTKDRIEIKEHKDRIAEEYSVEIVYANYEDAGIFDFINSKSEIDRMRNRLRQLGGTGQMELGIYEQEKQELERMVEERNDLVRAEEDLMNLIEEINKTAQQKFAETFELIRNNFRSIFAELFQEGDEADLRMVTDPDNPDPLDAKIDIIAKPRGKRPQLIDLLSGGEKTLTAIALLFAIYQVKPSPFCILDEVDAPLDDANIDRFVKIIRKFSKETQFIIVTHNKRTMEAADSMYGVTMAEQGISTIVNVKFNDQKMAS